MATPEQVEPFFAAQLSNDNEQAMDAIGDNWKENPLTSFYQDDISVDIAMKNIMLRILKMEHAKLPDQLWNRLGSEIDKETLAKTANATISEISSGAIHG